MTAFRARYARASRNVLVGLALLVGLSACGGDATGAPPASGSSSASPSAPPDATATPIPDSTEAVAVEPGTYRFPSSAWSVADYTVTFPEGWTVQDGAYLWHAPDGPGFEAFVPDTIYADACEGSQGEHMDVGPSVDDLVAALRRQRGPKASDPVDTTLGGYPAIRIDLTVRKGFDLKACNLPDALQIWYSHPADGYFVLFPDGIASVYIVDVDGQRQVFETQYGSATSDKDVRELQAILDSIHIET